jgi:cytochrome P450
MPAPEATVALGDLRRDPEAALAAVATGRGLVWVRAGRQRFLLASDPGVVREILLERAEELVKPSSQAIAVGRPASERVEDRLSPAALRRALARGMGADRAAETAALLAQGVTGATAAWRDGGEVPLMPWLRPLSIRAVVGGPFASALSADDVERLAIVVRWASGTPRVGGRRPTLHGISRPFALARLALVVRSLLANADLTRPSELSPLVTGGQELGPSLRDAERRTLVGELLLGAIEPLVQIAGWTLLRLGSEPEARARLREEWKAGLDRSYTESFVREVTRLHPTNPRITRAAVVDTKVGGETVPARTRVIVDVATLHRDPRVYPQPERFFPDRWLEGRLPEHRFSYAAFGIGERRCLGEAIATRALAALAEAIGRDWDLELGDVDVTAAGRRQPADNVRVTVRRPTS